MSGVAGDVQSKASGLGDKVSRDVDRVGDKVSRDVDRVLLPFFPKVSVVNLFDVRGK